MAEERLNIPQDEAYFQAIGLAVVAFARLEWNVVWCCERLQRNYILTIERNRKTAGTIANDAVRLFSSIPEVELRNKAHPLALEFKRIAIDRNKLLHGKPGTSVTGKQRLFRSSGVWSIADVNNFTDQCAVASKPLNALLYNELGEANEI